MKANSILKIAVVAMAAFGAYAFSGDVNSPQMFTRNDTCENISVACSNDGLYTCKVQIDQTNEIVDVWDLQCSKEIKHNQPEVLFEL